jgi:transcriptional regulator with XRE-family HTH domain
MDIKKLREERGLTQQRLADATGIPKHRIEKWETGQANPKVKDTEILKKFFFESVAETEHSSLVNYLKEQLAEKDKIIALLNQENGALRAKVNQADQFHCINNFNEEFPVLPQVAIPLPNVPGKENERLKE